MNIIIITLTLSVSIFIVTVLKTYKLSKNNDNQTVMDFDSWFLWNFKQYKIDENMRWYTLLYIINNARLKFVFQHDFIYTFNWY